MGVCLIGYTVVLAMPMEARNAAAKPALCKCVGTLPEPGGLVAALELLALRGNAKAQLPDTTYCATRRLRLDEAREQDAPRPRRRSLQPFRNWRKSGIGLKMAVNEDIEAGPIFGRDRPSKFQILSRYARVLNDSCAGIVTGIPGSFSCRSQLSPCEVITGIIRSHATSPMPRLACNQTSPALPAAYPLNGAV